MKLAKFIYQTITIETIADYQKRKWIVTAKWIDYFSRPLEESEKK